MALSLSGLFVFLAIATPASAWTVSENPASVVTFSRQAQDTTAGTVYCWAKSNPTMTTAGWDSTSTWSYHSELNTYVPANMQSVSRYENLGGLYVYLWQTPDGSTWVTNPSSGGTGPSTWLRTASSGVTLPVTFPTPLQVTGSVLTTIASSLATIGVNTAATVTAIQGTLPVSFVGTQPVTIDSAFGLDMQAWGLLIAVGTLLMGGVAYRWTTHRQ
jgi:hypothetical protein